MNQEIKLPSEIQKEIMLNAFNEFNRKSQFLAEAYQSLKGEIRRVNIELEEKNKELLHANKAIQRSHAFLDTVFEGLNDGVIILSKKGVIIKVNESFCRILKVEKTLLLDTNISIHSPLAKIRDLLKGLKSKSKGQYLNRTIHWKKEQTDWLEIVIGYMEAEKEHILILVRDLTEVKDLRAQLVQQEFLANIGEMAVTVAHEIRNPLGGIEGFASLLRRDLLEKNLNTQMVDKIIEGVRDLNSTVTGLLQFAKPLSLNIHKIDISQQLEKALYYVREDSGLREAGRQVDFKIGQGKNMVIYSDAELILQVFLNFIRNAVEMIEKTGTVEINVQRKTPKSLKQAFTLQSMHFDSERSYVCFSIKDSGEGIPPENLEKIFKPFFTTKSFGTGLGLAMVNKIIEILEARLDVIGKSDLGGAQFLFWLPDMKGRV